MINMEPHASPIRFQWGRTLLSLTRSSVTLPFRAATVTDVAVGELFVRLIRPDPPYEPLTPILKVRRHQPRRIRPMAV